MKLLAIDLGGYWTRDDYLRPSYLADPGEFGYEPATLAEHLAEHRRIQDLALAELERDYLGELW